MSGEKCRHCGGRIEYSDDWAVGVPQGDPWWLHVPPVPAWPAHEAAPAFGGGS